MRFISHHLRQTNVEQVRELLQYCSTPSSGLLHHALRFPSTSLTILENSILSIITRLPYLRSRSQARLNHQKTNEHVSQVSISYSIIPPQEVNGRS